MSDFDYVSSGAGSQGNKFKESGGLLSGFQSWQSQIFNELRANHRLVIGDLVASAFAVIVALNLAGGGSIAENLVPATGPLAILSCIIGLVVFPLAGVYRRHARSTSLRDIVLIMRGAGLAACCLAAIGSILTVTASVPFAVYVIQFGVMILCFSALRVVARSRELTRQNASLMAHCQAQTKVPVLLVGTGAACDLFVRSLRNTDSKFQPVGIIDDARNTQGLYFHDVQIIGTLLDSERVIEKLESWNNLPRRLFLTEPVTHFESDGIRRITRWCEANGISVSRVPGLEDHDTGKGQDVDPEEILDRPQKEVERSMLREMFKGRRVLVTGAGGSIGSELSRQIASFDPAELVMIDNCEFNAYSIDMDLSQNFADVPRRMYVASIRDKTRVNAIFERHRPELVFNAAALKHVPMVELNPCEGVLTNVIGTRNVADAARNVGAIAMVQVSTDKAVNTTNVMGATKRVAEFYVQAQDRITNETEEQSRFFSVRFGNVLGSSGSLIPLFQRQISNGGPLTVTDKRMERYFMTIREAVQLTLVAAASGLKQDTSHGEIFVLDMGRPVKIVDLAERMIRLAGLKPYEDIDIKFIGARPGEKLFEELFDASEQRHDSGIPGVGSARPEGVPAARLRAMIRKLEAAAIECDELTAKRLLKELVPGYGVNGLRPIDVSDLKNKPARVSVAPAVAGLKGKAPLPQTGEFATTGS